MSKALESIICLEVAILSLIAFYSWRLFCCTHLCLYCHNCYNFASDTVACGWCICLEMQWLQVGILTGSALRERKYTEGAGLVCEFKELFTVEEVYSVREWTLGVQIF